MEIGIQIAIRLIVGLLIIAIGITQLAVNISRDTLGFVSRKMSYVVERAMSEMDKL